MGAGAAGRDVFAKRFARFPEELSGDVYTGLHTGDGPAKLEKPEVQHCPSCWQAAA